MIPAEATDAEYICEREINTRVGDDIIVNGVKGRQECVMAGPNEVENGQSEWRAATAEGARFEDH